MVGNTRRGCNSEGGSVVGGEMVQEWEPRSVRNGRKGERRGRRKGEA